MEKSSMHMLIKYNCTKDFAKELLLKMKEESKYAYMRHIYFYILGESGFYRS